MRVKNWVVKTDIGVIRAENQDRATVLQNSFATLAILCDGMGGHEGGSYASSVTIDVFSRNFSKLKKGDDYNKWFSKTLEKSVAAMKIVPRKEHNQMLLDMGTTVVAALIVDNNVYVYNVGDSRCFYYNGIFYQVTIDQNLRNYLIREEHIPEEHASRVYGADALTSSLGPRKKTELEIFEFQLDDSSRSITLTSDGVHDYISKPNFETFVAKTDLPLATKALEIIARAIDNGSTDNLTILILELEPGAPHNNG